MSFSGGNAQAYLSEVKAMLLNEYNSEPYFMASDAEKATNGGLNTSFGEVPTGQQHRRRLSAQTLTRPVQDGVFHCDSASTSTLFDSGDKGIITTSGGRYATGLQVAVSKIN